MKNTSLIFFLVIHLFCNSQNLIQNCSFEATTLPLNCLGSNFSQVNNWQQLNTPDFFSNGCPYVGPFSAASLPNNFSGMLNPKQGNNLIAEFVYVQIGAPREYFYQQLSQSLKKDYIYCMAYYISRADNYNLAISNIDALFSSSIPVLDISGLLIASPQIKNYTGIVTDTSNWVLVTDTFIAKGNEAYVTIGNFTPDANINSSNVGSLTPNPTYPNRAYYFFDSISLYLCDSILIPPLPNQPILNELVAPNVFTPNYDGINDVFKIELKNATLTNFSIYDRWGILVKSDDIKSHTTILWDGRTTAGEVCTAGVYFYILQYTDANGDIQKKNGYITLIK